MVGEAAWHCGSGCALGDMCAEWLAFIVPAVAVAFGWHSIFPGRVFAVWVLEYVFACIFCIMLRFFTNAPDANLGLARGLWAAVKVDMLSLTARQVGMYGFMAVAFFWLRMLVGIKLTVNPVEFWFMMQIAMRLDVATSYPVNWWLLGQA